jgi:hypothetical protein
VRLAEDEDVFVGDQVERYSAAASVAGVLHLEERGAQDELAAAESGQECNVALGGDESGPLTGIQYGSGQVDQFPVVAPGPRDDHHGAAGAEDAAAFVQDAREGRDAVSFSAAAKSSAPGALRTGALIYE